MLSYAPIMRSHKPCEDKPSRDDPVDAADLTRRLTAHLESQKSSQRRSRRSARPPSTAAAEQDPKNDHPQTYHHVPVLAAASFTCTATADPHRIVHRLSAPVLAQAGDAGYAGSVQRAQKLDRARRERQMRGERNAWQWDREMSALHEGDVRRGVYQLPRRTFAGDEIEMDGTGGVEVEEVEKFEGRGDWAQEEEEERLQEEKTGRKGVKDMVKMLGRRSVKRRDEDEAVVTLEEFTSTGSEGKKSRRGSFLARLRWHSSQGT